MLHPLKGTTASTLFPDARFLFVWDQQEPVGPETGRLPDIPLQEKMVRLWRAHTSMHR